MRRELSDARDLGRIAAWFKPDAAIVTNAGNLILIEAKGQDLFESPPFDGHGLPAYQADNYMVAYRRCGVRTLLVVYERERRWWQWLDRLEDGAKYNTPGTVKKPRRIYPIESFAA